MAKYQRFEELPVWQEAARLYHTALELLEIPRVPLSSGFRNQLDRAALSVSNNIAEGYERATTRELLSFLAIARGSAGEVRSMIAVISQRSQLDPFAPTLERIRHLAESCARQITAWAISIESSSVQGQRYLGADERSRRNTAEKARSYRENFLRGLPQQHPLYHTPEARRARGENPDDPD